MKKKIPILVFLIALVCVGIFFVHSYNNFKIAENFTPIPLSFDPYSSTSSYDWNGAAVTIQGGFVKGKMQEKDNSESLLLRSLSPSVQITIKGGPQARTYRIRLENVNSSKIEVKNTDSYQSVEAHTVLLLVNLSSGQQKTIQVALKEQPNPEFVILGDNRNGYQTFSQIIDQINAIDPAFTIDNGDLVFGGEPNKYRLFYETVSKLQVPLYTTLGNHDIRENGRAIYTELFGPGYYSFDYQNIHFAFLDSSRGWTEKRSIPEEQYQWLEKDLEKAQGKRIFVVTHIPPTDPRAKTEPNQYPQMSESQKAGPIKEEISKLSGTSNLDHAFPDKEEAKRFESLMTKYKVDTVFLSHIHAYFSFVKDDVRYIISGGAGAELLTKDSYYHFIRVKVTDKENYLEVVELPSPPNVIVDRYLAAAQMFVRAIFKEYATIIYGLGAAILLIIGGILWIYRKAWWTYSQRFGRWISEIAKFSVTKYKEIVKKK
ncbi:metallophosphoesterase family protein [Desulfitobacterium sp.]|uniref:metallophosphoesterase family protein n=1 Tax=Desulfitobacterium sp. TaxID=49981 RepID=UPI002BA0DF0F|nr:metallophosphoesterase [Desulfitobacterium sp.]HVJ49525.1 metallophosphoesterase [Desulfitobacterium sp.]